MFILKADLLEFLMQIIKNSDPFHLPGLWALKIGGLNLGEERGSSYHSFFELQAKLDTCFVGALSEARSSVVAINATEGSCGEPEKQKEVA